jgi:hypothetical protein
MKTPQTATAAIERARGFVSHRVENLELNLPMA